MINETFFKISSRIPVTGEFKLDQEVIIKVGANSYLFNIVKIEQESTQDGQYNQVFKLKYFAPYGNE